MNLVELVREKFKDIPLELDLLKSRGIYIHDNGYETIMFRNSNNNQRLIKFERHTTLSNYPSDFIKIYNRIQQNEGACFIRDVSYLNEFVFTKDPLNNSKMITKDMISGEVLEILLMLNISLVVRDIEFLASNQKITVVMKLLVK